MKRFATIACTLLAALATGCSDLPSKPVPLPEMPALGEPVPLPDDPHREFDFWLGEWDVRNKHLKRTTWNDSGEAVARIQPVVDGGAVLEQWNGATHDDPLIGFSLRAYDPELEKWVIYLNWHGGSPGGFYKMHGARDGERLELFPPDDTTQSRYSFSLAHEDSCQWDEAVSTDGETWISTWVMQFTRREAPLPVDATNAPIVEPPDSAAAFTKTRALDFLIGAWEGSTRALQDDGSWTEGTARARVTSMIEGFGLLRFLDFSSGERTMAALGWDSRVGGWIAVGADNRSEGLARMRGEPGEGEVTFVGPTRRETWICPQADACSWLREASSDGGETWLVSHDAELTRSASTAAWIDIPKALTPFPDVLSGGQPSPDDLARAAANGYRTVVSLRSAGEKEELADEEELVRELGMNYVSIPIKDASDVTPENAQRLADALAAPEAYPAIVHCRSGNRVGALYALKAHDLEGTPAEEALEIGRRSGLTKLEPVVREHFGLPAKEE